MNKSINISLVLLTILAFGGAAFMPISAGAVCWDNWGGICSDGGVSTAGYNNYGYNNVYGYNNTSTNSINPAPMVYQVSPSSVPANIQGNIQITLTGGNFIPNSLAQFNNSWRPTTYVNSNRIIVTINSYDLQTIGSYVITVFNPMPGGGMSNGVAFNVNSGVINNIGGASSVATNTYNNTTKNTTSTNTNKTTTKVESKADANTVEATVNTQESYSTLTSNALFGIRDFAPSGLVQWVIFAILILIIVILTRKVFGFNDKYQKTPLKHA